MAGLWRVRFRTPMAVSSPIISRSPSIPEVVKRAAVVNAREVELGEAPAGAMNVMPMLAEIDERIARASPGRSVAHHQFLAAADVAEDMDILQRRSATAPSAAVARLWRMPRPATGARNVWSVQFFNAMGTIILDTLEIGDTPVARLRRRRGFPRFGRASARNPRGLFHMSFEHFGKQDVDDARAWNAASAGMSMIRPRAMRSGRSRPASPSPHLPADWRCPECDAPREIPAV